MKLLVLSSFIFLNIAMGSPLNAGELSSATVAERLAKDEGYRLFLFRSETTRSYRIAVRFNGAENAQDTLVIPACKECVVAVRFGKNNSLEAVRAYTDKASMSVVFPSGRFPDFNVVASVSPIQADAPFLSLRGPSGELQLILRPSEV